jgi:excisionase family DNA binding protein
MLNTPYTIDKVAALLDQQPSTIKTWLREGKIRGTAIGKSWVVLESDLQEFLQQRRRDTPKERDKRTQKAVRARQTIAANKEATSDGGE